LNYIGYSCCCRCDTDAYIEIALSDVVGDVVVDLIVVVDIDFYVIDLPCYRPDSC
jgi:hypothetical protein